jgi:GntR family transcriptional regulator, arabinose operon transcriptional repressor
VRFLRQATEDTPRAHAKEAIVRMVLSRDYKIGDKLPSYRQLASHFGIAVRTLVRALHELAEEGTVQLLHGKGVFLRKMPRGCGHLSTIGLASPATHVNLLHQSYLNQVLSGAIMLCGTNDIDLQIMAFRKVLQSFSVAASPRDLAIRVDGMILLEVLNERYIAELAREPIPLVLVDGQTATAPVPCIAVDNAQATNLVMDFLYGLGHRRIGYTDARSQDDLALDGEPAWLDTADTRERREAYLAALQRLELYYERVYPAVVGCAPERARAVAAHLRQDEQPPTAIVCYDDTSACSLYQLLVEGGIRVPQDISLAAAAGAKGSNLVDNQIITGAVLDFEEMGRRAVMALQHQTKGELGSRPQIERITGTLYIGTTTAAPCRR